VLQYNVTLERDLGANVGVRVSFIGSEMRKLLVNRDLNTMPASTTPFDLDDPADHARLPYPDLDPFLNAVLNAGDGWFRALQIEATRRFHRGLSIEAAYTRAASESTAPDLGNSSLGVVQYNPYDIEQDRGPDPQLPKHRFIMNATWELPVGRNQAHLNDLPGWAEAVLGGWTVSGIVQARRKDLHPLQRQQPRRQGDAREVRAGSRHHAAAASLRRAFLELVVVYPLGQGLPRVPVGSLHEAQGGGHRLAGE